MPTGPVHPDPRATTFALRSRRAVTPAGTHDRVVTVRDGEIASVQTPAEAMGVGAHDLGDLVLLPGLIDAHAHLNDPRPRSAGEPWEGFLTGTAAAAAGGITTVIDMPLNSLPVTTTTSALQAKRAAAGGRLHVDVACFAGLVPGNVRQLCGLIDAGAVGVKCFLCDSGLPEFPAVDGATLAEAMALLASRPTAVPLLAHAELVHDLPCNLAAADPRRYATWLASRPGSFERRAIAQLIELVGRTGCPLHIVHVADADALPLIADAKRRGLPVTAETCPHYLTFAAEQIADGDTRFKCAPPIRDARHRAALWDALRDGTLDFIATDHSPCPPAMKHADTGDWMRAWGGIASLELLLPAVWTAAQRHTPDLATLDRLARWLCHAPAQRFGLRAGIAPGRPANLVAFDPEASFTVRGDRLHHLHPLTPYEGLELRGVVRHTWLHGRTVFASGALVGPCTGSLLTSSHRPNPP